MDCIAFSTEIISKVARCEPGTQNVCDISQLIWPTFVFKTLHVMLVVAEQMPGTRSIFPLVIKVASKLTAISCCYLG